MAKLARSHVAVFGLGGVGSYVVEALARTGVGELTLVDHDRVSESNLNRQLIALRSTIGELKADVCAARVKDINPDCLSHVRACFFNQATLDNFDFSDYDYVVDAIDTVTAKLLLITSCQEVDTPILSSMGAGNKFNPAGFQLADIFDTEMDALARVMRKELRKRGVTQLKVVYSQEEAVTPLFSVDQDNPDASGLSARAKKTPGSLAFVPAAAGLLIASEVIKDLVLAN